MVGTWAGGEWAPMHGLAAYGFGDTSGLVSNCRHADAPATSQKLMTAEVAPLTTTVSPVRKPLVSGSACRRRQQRQHSMSTPAHRARESARDTQSPPTQPRRGCQLTRTEARAVASERSRHPLGAMPAVWPLLVNAAGILKGGGGGSWANNTHKPLKQGECSPALLCSGHRLPPQPSPAICTARVLGFRQLHSSMPRAGWKSMPDTCTPASPATRSTVWTGLPSRDQTRR